MSKPVDVSLPSEREIRVVRAFDAPAQLVFDFHTIPELVRKWMLGPDGWSMPVCEIDLRVGGQYYHLWRSDRGEGEFGARGTYKEIRAPHLVVNTERMVGLEGPGSETPEALCRLELTEKDGRTTLTATVAYPSQEIRDAVAATGMSDGMAASYDRLEGAMAKKAA